MPLQPHYLVRGIDRRDLFHPSRRPGAAGGAHLCGRRLLGRRRLRGLLCRRRRGRPLGRRSPADGLVAGGDVRLARRRRQRAVRLQQHHHLPGDTGGRVRDGGLRDRDGRRRHRPRSAARVRLWPRPGAAAVAEQQVHADDDGARPARARPAVGPAVCRCTRRTRCSRRTRGAGRRRRTAAARPAHPDVAGARPADGDQRRGVAGLLRLDLGIPAAVGRLRRPAAGAVGILRQGRPRSAVRPGIRHRADRADLRRVPGGPGGDGLVGRAQPPRRG